MSPMSTAGLRIGLVLDPIEGLNTRKDTSLAIIESAQKRGFDVFYIEQMAMRLDQGVVRARIHSLHVDLAKDVWFQVGPAEDQDLATLDVIFMRKDPPVDMNYIYSTYLLEHLEHQGVLVVNRPQSLRDCNEKLFATQFPQCCPPLMVSASMDELREFHGEYGDVIYKPLDGMGGRSIFRAQPAEHNLGVILETLTQHGTMPIMAQKYLPQIADGDKRILIVDGQPVSHCLARIPSPGESRGNLAAGGKGLVRELSDRDHWIVEQVRQHLSARGLMFVGLDVIGDCLTEINITSPTCAREIDRGAGIDIGGMLMDAVERHVTDRSTGESHASDY